MPESVPGIASSRPLIPSAARRKAALAVYQVLATLAWPLVWLRLLWRSRREPAYRKRVRERLGIIPAAIPRDALWIHAVSAGEVIALAPLLDPLAKTHADQAILVTTTTPSGSAQVQRLFAHLPNVAHCYAPYDSPGAVRRFLTRVRPKLLALVETELWPTQIQQASAAEIPIVLLNGRLSERSAGRYLRLPSLTFDLFAKLNAVACQAEAHRSRFLSCGVSEERIFVSGSIKFDAQIPQNLAEVTERFAHFFNSVPKVWMAASTHAGEEAHILAAHSRLQTQFSGLCLILAPRHPHRCNAIVKQITEHGFSVKRSSEIAPDTKPVDVFLVDELGLLLPLFPSAAATFLGGSLVPHGGHNPIEPALMQTPFISGPHIHNFADIFAEFPADCVLDESTDPADYGAALAAVIAVHINDALYRKRRGQALLAVVQHNRGANDRQKLLLEEAAALTSTAFLTTKA